MACCFHFSFCLSSRSGPSPSQRAEGTASGDVTDPEGAALKGDALS